MSQTSRQISRRFRPRHREPLRRLALPGAATSNNDLAVIQEIARIAERGGSTCCSSPTDSSWTRAITRPSCAASSRRR